MRGAGKGQGLIAQGRKVEAPEILMGCVHHHCHYCAVSLRVCCLRSSYYTDSQQIIKLFRARDVCAPTN